MYFLLLISIYYPNKQVNENTQTYQVEVFILI